VRAEGKFHDLVAYGGWSMDDHHPGGMRYSGPPTIFHPAPSPYGIPYRCLYSRNIENLFCAGRNISTTHAALSSTRVMGTCSILGQAIGTAAAIAAREGLTPRGVYAQRVAELQATLMEDDCYLPWHVRPAGVLSREATLTASTGDAEPLRNGHDRPLGEADNGWTGPLASFVEYRWDSLRVISEVRFTFDSDLDRVFRTGDRNRGQNMHCCYRADDPLFRVPDAMVKAFRIETQDSNGAWVTVARVGNNHKRLLRVPVEVETAALRFIPEATWGAAEAHVFAFEAR
jgi:hypothetical protein